MSTDKPLGCCKVVSFVGNQLCFVKIIARLSSSNDLVLLKFVFTIKCSCAQITTVHFFLRVYFHVSFKSKFSCEAFIASSAREISIAMLWSIIVVNRWYIYLANDAFKERLHFLRYWVTASNLFPVFHGQLFNVDVSIHHLLTTEGTGRVFSLFIP